MDTTRSFSGLLSFSLPHARSSVVMLTPQRLSLSSLRSAFGCGAFCNPPDHMAELFREVLEKEYRGCFQHICFAIFGTAFCPLPLPYCCSPLTSPSSALDDHNSRKAHNPLGNVLPFKRVFGVSTPADEEAAARVVATRPGGGDGDDDEAEEAQEGRLPQQRGGGPRDATGRGGRGQSERGGPRGGAGRGGRNTRVTPGGRGKS